jgi:dipeptidyl aminopeptidase/acylaminoacyl peptidase
MTRRLALIALFALALLAAACGGSSESSSDGGGGDASGAPTGLQLVVYRDTLLSKLVAQSVPDGRRWERPIDQQEFIVALDCSHDGERAAYLVKDLQGRSEVRFSAGQAVSLAGDAFGLAWAPDGSRLAITTFTPTERRNRLELLDPDSGTLTTAAEGNGPIGAPRWSPDGTKVVYDATNEASNELFVYTLDEPSAVLLETEPSPVFAPDWAPDGNSIVFGAPSKTNISQLFSVAPDGTNVQQVTSSQISKGVPRWSPDGSLVAFAGTVLVPIASRVPARLHNLAVYIMNPDGSGEQQLTDLQQDAWLLGWCRSGPWLDDGWEEAAAPQ